MYQKHVENDRNVLSCQPGQRKDAHLETECAGEAQSNQSWVHGVPVEDSNQ